MMVGPMAANGWIEIEPSADWRTIGRTKQNRVNHQACRLYSTVQLETQGEKVLLCIILIILYYFPLFSNQ